MSMIFQISGPSREFCRETDMRSAGNLTPISLAVARVVAWGAELPPTAVVDLDAHWRTHVEPAVNERIGTLNEDLVKLNYRQTLEFARAFYATRYNMVHGTRMPLPSGSITVTEFFGVTESVSPALLKLIGEECPSLSRLVNGVRRLCQELDELKNGAVAA